MGEGVKGRGEEISARGRRHWGCVVRRPSPGTSSIYSRCRSWTAGRRSQPRSLACERAWLGDRSLWIPLSQTGVQSSSADTGFPAFSRRGVVLAMQRVASFVLTVTPGRWTFTQDGGALSLFFSSFVSALRTIRLVNTWKYTKSSVRLCFRIFFFHGAFVNL